jgi:acetone carboxylase gamma subunit
MVKRGWLLTQIKVTEPKKDLFELTPYVKVVEDKEGKKITQCSQCGHTYGLATENFMIGCLIYDRDPKDIQPPNLAPDKDWMVYREFYCPGCGIQVEVEAVPPGMTILNKIELKL